LRPETARGANNWSVFEHRFRHGPIFLKNRPRDIENPAALILGGGFRIYKEAWHPSGIMVK